MAELAKKIVVKPGSLEIDSKEFPWLIGDMGVGCRLQAGKVPSVTLELIAERVEIEDAVESGAQGIVAPKIDIVH